MIYVFYEIASTTGMNLGLRLLKQRNIILSTLGSRADEPV